MPAPQLLEKIQKNKTAIQAKSAEKKLPFGKGLQAEYSDLLVQKKLDYAALARTREKAKQLQKGKTHCFAGCSRTGTVRSIRGSVSPTSSREISDIRKSPCSSSLYKRRNCLPSVILLLDACFSSTGGYERRKLYGCFTSVRRYAFYSEGALMCSHDLTNDQKPQAMP